MTHTLGLTRHIKLFLAAAPLLLLSAGCAMLPGMYMDESLPSLPTDTTLPEGRRLEVVRIDAELLQSMRSTGDEEVGWHSDADNEEGPAPMEEIDGYRYRVGPQDVLSVTVWEHPELTIPQGSYRSSEAAGHLVDADGYIYYPFVGRLQVAGKSLEEVRRLLTDRLSVYINEPQLDVRVASYRSKRAYVVGEVRDPGPLPITDIPLTVVEAINRAGGFTSAADLEHVQLTRAGETMRIDLMSLYQKGRHAGHQVLSHGDVLLVPDSSRRKVFVLGEVERPGSFLMERQGMSLAEAISEAGGVNLSTANPGRIYVIRGTPNRPKIFHLDMRSADAIILADAFDLEGRDAVYVDTAPLPRWNRAVISQIAPTLGIVEQGIDIIDRYSK
ncbi:MAG: polysaccharide biosynthesis/export family protein [Spirochaetaceae bacterium]|nr:polysaccharide biosynthesis/export family protein [Spirochaetaceae bacterium]